MANINMTRVSREEIYQQVWKKPLTTMAKEYGLTDVGLAKICDKLQIPRPPQGYWAKKHKQDPPPLPETDGPNLHKFWTEGQETLEEPEFHDPRTHALIAEELKRKNKINVKKRLLNPNPLVLATSQGLADTLPDQYNRLSRRIDGCLEINITREAVPRTLLILDAIVKALEARGYPVEATKGKSMVTVLGERLTFSIKEKTVRYTPSKSDKEKTRTLYQPNYRYAYKPTGILTLSIETWPFGFWTDNKKRLIEECINGFIIGLIKTADAIKRREHEYWKKEERRRKQRENEEARIRQINAEDARREKLKQSASDWQEAQRIRDFIQAVENKSNRIEPASELAAWIIWASNYANNLDPLSKQHKIIKSSIKP